MPDGVFHGAGHGFFKLIFVVGFPAILGEEQVDNVLRAGKAPDVSGKNPVRAEFHFGPSFAGFETIEDNMRAFAGTRMEPSKIGQKIGTPQTIVSLPEPVQAAPPQASPDSEQRDARQ
jgi:hypothetical protein